MAVGDHLGAMAPTVTEHPNRASLGWNGSFVPCMCIPQILINCKMLSIWANIS